MGCSVVTLAALLGRLLVAGSDGGGRIGSRLFVAVVLPLAHRRVGGSSVEDEASALAEPDCFATDTSSGKS